jgi:hypothetical protein
MRKKITALLVAGAALVGFAAAAHAAPVTVALYLFSSQGDVQAFQKVQGAKCEKKWRQNNSMQVTVGAGTTACAFRTSVVADSSDVRADHEIAATGFIGGATPKNRRKKSFVSVFARSSENSGYELRVRPYARSWQLFRDPRGQAQGPTLFRSGKGKFIRPKGKPNLLTLRAFDHGAADTTVVARVNSKVVLSFRDTGNSQPDGRRTAVGTGVKGSGSGTGVVGIFDNVAVRVPNPF